MTLRIAVAATCVLAFLPATVASASGASDPPAVPAQAAEGAGVPAILARQPLPRVYSAEQPDAGDWPRIAAHGVTTVVDLRPAAERPGRDEAAEVRAAGMAYRQIPVAGADGVTPEAARTLWQAIDAAPGKVLVHCASGNRAGALLAIAAVREGGVEPEQALAIGRTAGMTSLEPRVRALLGLPVAREP